MDVLLNRSEVVNGLIRLENGLNYSILCCLIMIKWNIRHCQRIATLIQDGSNCRWPKPVSSYSLKDRDQNDISLENWQMRSGGNRRKTVTENKYGKGKVIWGKQIEDILEELDYCPIWKLLKWSCQSLFIHKKVDNDDIYFVVNQEDKPFILNVFQDYREVTWNMESQYGNTYRQLFIRRRRQNQNTSWFQSRDLCYCFSDETLKSI